MTRLFQQIPNSIRVRSLLVLLFFLLSMQTCNLLIKFPSEYLEFQAKYMETNGSILVKMFTMVKDEADIISDWVHYHATICGYKNIYVVDNNSSDGTYDQLLELQSNFGIIVSQEFDYTKKGEYMLKLIQNQQSKTKFLIPLDVDEFLVLQYIEGPKSHTISVAPIDIQTYLKGLPIRMGYKAEYIYAQNHIEGGSTRAPLDFAEGSLQKYGPMAKTFYHADQLPKNIDHGNHHVHGSLMSDLESVELHTDLRLVHYHDRSHHQLVNKAMNNWKGFGYSLDLNNLIQNKTYWSSVPGGHYYEYVVRILQSNGTENLMPCCFTPASLGSTLSLSPLRHAVSQFPYSYGKTGSRP